MFETPSGFSDHTAEPDFSALAVAAGARVLEKHLTLDRGLPGPDHAFSLTPEMFATYVIAARKAAEVLGDGRLIVTAQQREVRLLARGSIVCRQPIRAGQVVKPADIMVQRPGDGIDPARWHEVIGRTSAMDIPAHAQLDWSMLR
jgi:sialic acid synthase SpsE